MRKSIDGLMAVIRDTYEMDPYSNSLFLFCGRRCDRIKALHFEKDGFCLLYKRLDNGRFQWPRNSAEIRNLTRQEYRWLWKGCPLTSPGQSGLPGKRISDLCAKGRKFFFPLWGRKNAADGLSTCGWNHQDIRRITLPISFGVSFPCGKHSVFYGCRLVEMVCFPHFGFVKMTVPVQRKIRFSAGFPV